MVQSRAESVSKYIDELTPERSAILVPVLDTLRKAIKPGFQEVMNWGMISFEVPLEVFSNTYNKKPLLYCSLAAQKRHFGLYLMNIYSDSKALEILQKGYQKAGVKLDMGKSCIRFKNLNEIHMPTIKKVVGLHSVKQWVECYSLCRG